VVSTGAHFQSVLVELGLHEVGPIPPLSELLESPVRDLGFCRDREDRVQPGQTAAAAS
jgi:hypothetical protein